MTRLISPVAYECFPLSLRKTVAWSASPFWRACMNELTTTAACSSSGLGRQRRSAGGPEGASAEERERCAVGGPCRQVVGPVRHLGQRRTVRANLIEVGVAAKQDRVLARPARFGGRQRVNTVALQV